MPVFTAAVDAAGVITIPAERSMGAEDVTLEAVTSADMTTWRVAAPVSETPALNGRATITWQARGAGERRFM